MAIKKYDTHLTISLYFILLLLNFKYFYSIYYIDYPYKIIEVWFSKRYGLKKSCVEKIEKFIHKKGFQYS